VKKVCKRYGSVYVARNMTTGDCYVGQTIKPMSYRVGAHKSSAKNPKTKFGSALADFGFAQFVFSELFVAFNRDALNEAEKHFIEDLRPVYNSTIGGAGVPGRMVSAATREKHRAAMRKCWADPLWRAKTTAAITAVCQSEDAVVRGRTVGTLYGGRFRWAGHMKKVRVAKERGVGMKAAWENPVTRAKITAGIVLAYTKPEVRARCSLSAIGRKHSIASVEKIARSKWKPVFCREMQTSFLSQKHAAEYFGVGESAIANAVANKGRVQYKYTLARVA